MWTWSSQGFSVSPLTITKRNMRVLHKEGVSGVSAEGDFKGWCLAPTLCRHSLTPSSLGCPAAFLPGMPNYSATQFIMTPSMFSVATAPPLSLHRGKLSVWNPPPVLTFVIFILLIFPPIPFEGAQKAANYLWWCAVGGDLWQQGHCS